MGEGAAQREGVCEGEARGRWRTYLRDFVGFQQRTVLLGALHLWAG